MRNYLFFVFVCTFAFLDPPTFVKKPRSMNELRPLLRSCKQYTGQISLLLGVGQYFTLKTGSERADMDSVVFFTDRTMKLSTLLKAEYWLARCCYVWMRLNERAVHLLNSSGNKERNADQLYSLVDSACQSGFY